MKLAQKIHDRIVKSRLARIVYDQKNYIEIGSGYLNFLLMFGSMSMTFTFLAQNYAGWEAEQTGLSAFLLFALFILWVSGLTIRKFGLFGTEKVSEMNMNPVSKEIFEAARIIKRWESDKNASMRLTKTEQEKPHYQIQEQEGDT